MNAPLLLAVLLAGAEPPADPLPAGGSETVTVRLLVVDALVLDRRDRTVPGLTAADFELRLDGKRVPIDTFDAECTGEAVADPAATDLASTPRIAALPEGEPRRVVLVFDERHLQDFRTDPPSPRRAGAYEQARRLVREPLPPGLEIAVAAVGDGVRFEADFTTDHRSLLAAVDRLEADMTIFVRAWGVNGIQGLTAKSWLADLGVLLRRLEPLRGPKSVVLFSAYSRSVRPTDLQMRELAAAAGAARTSFYPVDAAGLLASTRPSRLRVLSRLAVDTGGRETVNTNDLTLAAARASRDLGCRYALGTYVRGAGRRSGSIVVDVFPKGTRALHPAGYRLD
ncbi:MAG TPA: VWA domain-containing protein [Candidatus Polarisedimenticolaceae bacterium]